MLVHHKLSNMIDHHVAWLAKQHAIFHVKCTWWILPCPVVRRDVYSKMWSCFHFRRSTWCFNNKLIHDLSLWQGLNYILQAMIELFLGRYLHWKYWVQYINNCEWSINTKNCLFFANEQSLSLRTSTRSPTCRTTHRAPVWSIERSIANDRWFLTSFER